MLHQYGVYIITYNAGDRIQYYTRWRELYDNLRAGTVEIFSTRKRAKREIRKYLEKHPDHKLDCFSIKQIDIDFTEVKKTMREIVGHSFRTVMVSIGDQHRVFEGDGDTLRTITSSGRADFQRALDFFEYDLVRPEEVLYDFEGIENEEFLETCFKAISKTVNKLKRFYEEEPVVEIVTINRYTKIEYVKE